MDKLYEMARGRHRPEDVAEAIISTIGDALPVAARAALEVAARHSMKRRGWNYSSMATSFYQAHVRASRQVEVAAKLMATLDPLPIDRCGDPDALAAFVAKASGLIGRAYGDQQRMNKAARRAAGIMKGHRWYNKRFRLLKRLEEKIERQIRNVKRNRLRQASKTVLVADVRYEDFSADALTAAFVAYYAARLGVRSTFTNTAQARAFDEVASALYALCKASPTTRWFAVAHVMADRDVVRRLTEEERGRLLGLSYSLLDDAASILRASWTALGEHVERSTMIVQRGADSSTWNEAAGGWNRAREHWISLLCSLGMQDVLERQLPGKAMRLMAADVARWHRLSGGELHPDTKVWAALPAPWDVLDGSAACPRMLVLSACEAEGVKPDSWVSPRDGDRIPETFRPTPELVHGVEVSSPALALSLRRIGVFSGRSVRGEVPAVEVVRDEHGMAVYAHDVTPD